MSVLLLFSYTLFFLSTWVKDSTFCFLFSDEEDPKRFTAVPATDTPTIDEPPSQEADPVVKSPKAPRAPVKKVIVTCGKKHTKKSTDVGASLEAHQCTSSSGVVRVDTGMLSFVSYVIFILTQIFLDRS
jgi:hypothetical protein